MDTSGLAYTHDGQAVLVGSRTEAQQGRLPGAMCVRSGAWFYPMLPDEDDIHIDDIAHALAMICRYTGHTSKFWSVAAHSIEVSYRVELACKESYPPERLRRTALTALLHDASEAYLVDVPRGLKPLFTGYKDNEERLERAVARRFGLLYPFPSIIKTHDDDILQDEIANFFEPGSGLWEAYGITQRGRNLWPLPPLEGKEAFLRRYEELTR